MAGKLIDLTGSKFGRLTVIRLEGLKPTRWVCRCECGNEKIIRKNDLGKTISCGCLRAEKIRSRNTTHGLRHENRRLYNIWLSIKQRCSNSRKPGYSNYGGRGIIVCKEWLDYKVFHDWAISSGYTHDLTIERVDVNKGYFPDNCTWITLSDQQWNKRSSRYITVNGVTKHLTEWANLVGLRSSAITYRIDKMGWNEEKAVLTPSSRKSFSTPTQYPK
jgi:hypothetical protein